MARWHAPCLMLVTDRARLRGRPIEEVVSQAVDGGVTAVQLREKDLAGGELYDMALTLRHVLRGRALLLVNDRIDVALAAGADGVHLPEQSLPFDTVCELAGDACIIGRSVHSAEAARQAIDEGVDYLVAGTVFETRSKPDARPGSLDLVRAVSEGARLPVVAIGGITETNAAAAVEAGADGVAVIGAILDADAPRDAAAALRAAIDEAYEVV